MAFEPQFTVSARLLRELEAVVALREKLTVAPIQVAWIPALQKDARTRNTHASTAIEGNPLTLEEVRALEAGRKLPQAAPRSRREVMNYFAALRWVEKWSARSEPMTHEDMLHLHSVIAGGGVMDPGHAGKYRTIHVRVGRHLPPGPVAKKGSVKTP